MRRCCSSRRLSLQDARAHSAIVRSIVERVDNGDYGHAQRVVYSLQISLFICSGLKILKSRRLSFFHDTYAGL